MQKILLVDDREDNLLSIASILEPDGYVFVKANSGRQALKILLREFDFALILMDVKMPNLNGFETATLIYEREKLRHIPIIFITANNYGDENIFQGYKAGAVDYIYKPINADLLRAKVSVFIDLYKKNHRLLAQEQKLRAANEQLEKEIEERKKSEAQVNELNVQLMDNIEQLKSTNEELDNFAYIASHDLQEPLRKIRTFSDMLVKKYGETINPSAIDYLEKIDRSSKRMQQLIDDILSFSRFSNNSDDFIPTDLNVLLDQVVSDLELTIEEKSAQVRATHLPTLQVVPAMISQLFQNLLSNALKFSRPGIPPVIDISTGTIKGTNIPGIKPHLTQEEFNTISFSDNGTGFEEKYAEMIFIIFKRLENNKQGTGIGLAICKKIVDKHHGYIYATSSPGKGSKFTIALPAEREEAE
ncbi:MAG: response regulator [Ferruginibacter sp.]|nr:response regulator [Ferruginibacter sp.]